MLSPYYSVPISCILHLDTHFRRRSHTVKTVMVSLTDEKYVTFYPITHNHVTGKDVTRFLYSRECT